MSEKIVKFDDIEICTESFGNAEKPAILLMMGATASMLWWDEEFCRQLAGDDYFVIRYDNRDVGRSTVYEAGNISYTIEDLGNDAFHILDDYNIEKAHLVGMSLGGLIAQIMMLQASSRIITTTLISSSALSTETSDLPEIDSKIIEHFAAAEKIDWQDEKSAADFMVENRRLQSGRRHRFDAPDAYRLAAAEIDRAKDLPAMFNHALLGGGEKYFDRMNEIQVPVLIIHGTLDPVNAFAHAKFLAENIPNANLLALEGAGHEINRHDWSEIIKSIKEQTGKTTSRKNYEQ